MVFAVSVTEQDPVPEHPPPLQPAKKFVAAGAASRRTVVPLRTDSVHAAPQLIPPPVTVPAPVPGFATVSWKCGSVKVAVIVVSAVSATEHGPVAEHPPPLQPVKTEPRAGVAVSVIAVPLVTVSVQSAPQLIAFAGTVLVTVPVPAPAFVTVRACAIAKVAVTVTELVIGTVQFAVPLQPPPLQPVKSDPAPALAVSVIPVPLATVSVQSAPQLIAFAGTVLVTVPVPAPAKVTVSVRAVAKVAVTVTELVIGTVQFAVPLQPPRSSP